jgi:cytoskeletal protein RodZ
MNDDMTDTARSFAAPRTLGERLRAAREAKGLSLQELSTRTKIPARQLNALENDAHEHLPGIIFAVGFAKSYARELGLDPEEAASQYRAETTRPAYVAPSVSFDPIEPERLPSRRMAWVGGGIALAVVAGVIIWYQTRSSEPVTVADTTPAAVQPAPAPAAQPADGLATAAPADGSAQPTPPPGQLPASVGGAIAPPQPAPGQQQLAPQSGGGTVVLTAKQDAWIQITDRSTRQKLVSRTLKQGESYSVPPGDLTLWTGRAGAIDIRVGGRAIPPLGGEAETIRDVSLTPGSLLGRAAAAAPVPQIRPAQP